MLSQHCPTPVIHHSLINPIKEIFSILLTCQLFHLSTIHHFLQKHLRDHVFVVLVNVIPEVEQAGFIHP